MSLKYRNPKAGVKVVQIVQNLRLGTQKSGRNGKFEIDEPLNSTLRRKSCECSECGSQTLFQKRNMQISLRGRQRNQENIYFRDRRRQTLNQKSGSLFWQKYQKNKSASNTICLKSKDSFQDELQSLPNLNALNKLDSRQIQKKPQNELRFKTDSALKTRALLGSYIRSPLTEKRNLFPLIDSRNQAKQKHCYTRY